MENREERPGIISLDGCVVTTGTFDGVHRGHQTVLRALREHCHAGETPVVVTFDRHPLEVICPERAPGLLMLPQDRDALLRSCGVEVLELVFDSAMRDLTASEWLDMIKTRYGARGIVLGYDNTFGSDGRRLTLQDYARIGKERGLEVSVVPELEGISSTTVRRTLKSGDVEGVAGMLGRNWTLSGIVTEGRKVGRRLGYPTANLTVDPRLLLPASGVYSTTARLSDGSLHPAITFVGTRPTFDNGEISVETHIPDFSGGIYDQPMELEFRHRIRGERRFENVEQLKQQIEIDLQKI